MTDHWTDHATERPIFDTVIPARGPGANLFEIVGKARVFMRQLGIPRDKIDALSNGVMEAPDYETGIALVEKWFRVDRGEQ